MGGYGFDVTVPAGGYAWWYIDALSDDGRFGLSLIAFVGSVFSPYYALNRRLRRSAAPDNHVSVNVAIYGADGYRWAMTERGRDSLARDANSLTIGPSRLTSGDTNELAVEFDEIAVPVPRRIRGRLKVRPQVMGERTFAIHPDGAHRWRPIAPRARIAVDLETPRRSWSGSAYVDSNSGTAPIETAFRSWSWSRSIEPEHTRIYYDTVPVQAPRGAWHVAYENSGMPQPIDAPPLTPYGRTAWQLPLIARSDAGAPARLLETWEDGPFYARCLIRHRVHGRLLRSVHETVSLERFAKPVVQAMLPFRMPRAPRRR